MSEAVKTLPHAAFKVLTILAAQCWVNPIKNKGQNGTAALTERYVERFGLVGRDTLYRSLKELRDRKLIVVTREGQRVRQRFTLYALNWLPITHRDGKPLDQWEQPDISAWENWKPETIPVIGSVEKNNVTDYRECKGPTVGSDNPKYVPINRNRDSKYTPTIGNTSRYLGEVGGRGAGPCSPARILDERIAKLISLQSDLLDSDIARSIHGATIELVAEVRARLADGWRP